MYPQHSDPGWIPPCSRSFSREPNRGAQMKLCHHRRRLTRRGIPMVVSPPDSYPLVFKTGVPSIRHGSGNGVKTSVVSQPPHGMPCGYPEGCSAGKDDSAYASDESLCSGPRLCESELVETTTRQTSVHRRPCRRYGAPGLINRRVQRKPSLNRVGILADALYCKHGADGGGGRGQCMVALGNVTVPEYSH